MSFAVTIVDAEHRASVFAEIEFDGEIVAEAFAEAGTMRVAFVDPGGDVLWETAAEQLHDALRRAHGALVEAGLVDGRSGT